MGSFSLIHWIILLAVVLLFFGAGRLPNVMGDFAKGIKAFRAGMRDEEPKAVAEQAAPPTITPGVTAQPAADQTVSNERKAG
jgi:sec-independent protein translocase protein TatA